MINLLPPRTREDILYARRNTKLTKWILATTAGLLGVGIVVLGGAFYIRQSIKTYEKRVAIAQEQLRIQKLDETQKRVQDISGSLKLVVQVLSREVLFSKLLQQIGAAMPSGASLASLSINKTQGGIDLNAVAKDYQTATQVQVNLQDPKNKIFDKAEIVSVTCSSNATDPTYPCQITLKALFAKNTPFLFINSSSKAVKQ